MEKGIRVVDAVLLILSEYRIMFVLTGPITG